MPSKRKSSRKPHGQSSPSRQLAAFQQQLHSWVEATQSDAVVQRMRESKRVALEAISELWRVTQDPQSRSRLKPQQRPAMEIDRAGLARSYLETIAKVAKDPNALFKHAGRPEDGNNTREMLDLLAVVCKGKPLDHCVIDEVKDFADNVPQDRHNRRIRVQRERLRRFCAKVDAALHAHFYRPETAAFCTPERITDTMIRNTFSSWPGVKLPEDVPAFRQAVKHYAELQSRKPE